MDHYERNKILADEQHGFRARRSCETQLLQTIQDIADGMSEGDQVDAVLLDFSKAFDKVPHKRLMYKLDHYSIRGKTHEWIQDFLTERKQHVLLEGKRSTTADVISGVPQGTVLGPLLFLTFINDMPQQTKSEIRLFADDSLLLRRIRSPQDTEILQNDLTALEKWGKDWQMEFNPNKCTVIHITTRKHPIATPYLLHDHALAREENSKYLGATINQDLKWNKHIANTTTKANRTLGFVKRNMKDCKTSAKAAAYKTLIRPTLEYASVVWDPYTKANVQQLEKVQRRAARLATGNYTDYTPGAVTGLLKDLGWDTLERRRTRNRLSMFYKIQHGQAEVTTENIIPGAKRTRGRHRIREIPSSKDYHRYSFFPRTIRQWNKLPPDVAEAGTPDRFGAMLDRLPAGHPSIQ